MHTEYYPSPTLDPIHAYRPIRNARSPIYVILDIVSIVVVIIEQRHRQNRRDCRRLRPRRAPDPLGRRSAMVLQAAPDAPEKAPLGELPRPIFLRQAPHPSGPPKLTPLRADLPPYIPPSARSKYAPAADSRALFSVEVVAPSRDEKSELPAPATRPVEGTSGAAYLRGYLPDSKEWLRNAERARVAAAAAAAAAQSAHGEPGGHAAAYEGGIAGGYGERPVV